MRKKSATATINRSQTLEPAPETESAKVAEPIEISEPAVEVIETVELVPIVPVITLNSTNLTGRVGAEPDIRYYESGKVKVTLSLAVRGISKDKTDWFNIEIWDKLAEIAANYVHKGTMIGISGYLKIETWTDPLGNERSKPVVNVKQLDLLGSPGRSSQNDDEEIPY